MGSNPPPIVHDPMLTSGMCSRFPFGPLRPYSLNKALEQSTKGGRRHDGSEYHVLDGKGTGG